MDKRHVPLLLDGAVVIAIGVLSAACSFPAEGPTGPSAYVSPASLGDGSARVGTLSNRDVAPSGTVPTGFKVNTATTAEGNHKVEWSWIATTHTTRYELKWERCDNLPCDAASTKWIPKGSAFAYDVYHDRYINEAGHYRSFVRAYLGNVPIGGWSAPAFWTFGSYPEQGPPDAVACESNPFGVNTSCPEVE